MTDLNSSTLPKLTSKQLNAIPLLASGSTNKDVASAINVNPATISQWLNHNIEFQQAIKIFSAKSLGVAESQLGALAIEAVAELRKLLVEAKSEQVRLKAIELILGSGGLSEARKSTGQYVDQGLMVSDASRYDFNKLLEAVTGG